MKILITGIGITGKSTFRKKLSAQLSELFKKWGKKVEDYDCDYDRKIIPKKFLKNRIYIIEDVHGPTPEAFIPLDTFDLIFYLMPSRYTHLRFWASRILIWFPMGRFSWDPDKEGWLGTGKPYDVANTVPILKIFWHDFKNRRGWIEEDLHVIKCSAIKTITVTPGVTPGLKNGKITFSINL